MLIQPNELKEKLQQENSVILCCLLKPVGASADAGEPPEFIPSSRIFDIDEFSEAEAEFPHTLLSPEAFQIKARELGINQGSSLFVYDNIGIYSSPRLWFNFTLMGCKNILLLNGGLPAWKENGYGLSDKTAALMHSGDFIAHQVPNMVASKEDVLMAITQPNCRIIDVRSADRFYGRVPEPRPGVRSGHIPGSANIPFANFIQNGRFKDIATLSSIFKAAGCNHSQEVIFSCGSGVTACIGYVAAYLCGYKNIKVYDGSWAEWGAIDTLPIEVS